MYLQYYCMYLLRIIGKVADRSHDSNRRYRLPATLMNNTGCINLSGFWIPQNTVLYMCVLCWYVFVFLWQINKWNENFICKISSNFLRHQSAKQSHEMGAPCSRAGCHAVFIAKILYYLLAEGPVILKRWRYIPEADVSEIWHTSDLKTHTSCCEFFVSYGVGVTKPISYVDFSCLESQLIGSWEIF